MNAKQYREQKWANVSARYYKLMKGKETIDRWTRVCYGLTSI